MKSRTPNGDSACFLERNAAWADLRSSRYATLAKLLKIKIGIAPNSPGGANKNKQLA